MDFHIPPLKSSGSGETESKLGEKTSLSLHFVILVVVVAIWLARLSDHVETLEIRIHQIETQLESHHAAH